MRVDHSNGRRLAGLTGLCTAVALGTAAHVAAYPATPEGEQLYAVTGATEPWIAPEPVPAAVVTSAGIDWSGVIALAAGAGLAALVVIAAAFVLTDHRRRSAGAY